MDLGTQNNVCSADCCALDWQQGVRDPGRSGIVTQTASLQGDNLPENTVMVATSEKDPVHIKETKILRGVGPRKVITKSYFFCWVSCVRQIFCSTTLQWSAPESWLLNLASNHTDFDCARRDQLPNWHIRCSDEMLRAILNKPLFAGYSTSPGV